MKAPYVFEDDPCYACILIEDKDFVYCAECGAGKATPKLHPTDSYNSEATEARIRADLYVRLADLWNAVNETEGEAREAVAAKIEQVEREIEGFNATPREY